MKRSVTLSRYLAGIIVLFAILFMAASFASLWTLSFTMQDSFAKMNALSATLVASRLDEFFAQVRDSTHHIASMANRQDIYPQKHLQEYLNDSLQDFPFLDRIEILGQDGRIVALAPADPDSIGISREGEDIYESVKKAGGAYWSDSYISLQGNMPAVTYGISVGSNVILVGLNLRWLRDFTSNALMIPDHLFEIRLTDGNGILLYHPDMLHVLRRERQTDFTRIREYRDSAQSIQVMEGPISWLVSTKTLRGPDWHVLVMYPQEAFYASLRRTLLDMLGLSVFIAVIGAVFWRQRLRRVWSAFRAISGEASRISQGDYGKLRDFGDGFAEFEEVGQSLDRMVGAIGEREGTLRDRERGFREVLESIELVAITVDHDGFIKYANPYALKILGYLSEEILDLSFKSHLCAPGEHCPFENVLLGGQSSTLVRSAILAKNGEQRIIDWSVVRNLDSGGRLSGATGIGHDTTEMIQARERIEKSLNEKDILLREVHHRVKNNLQVVASLLSLQQSGTDDPYALDALLEAGSRIHSIALVHELLYSANDFSGLDFKTYAESLASHLLASKVDQPIQYRFNFGGFKLSLVEAVPCGLILNEAVTNSMKHAFPSGWKGIPQIVISGKLQAEGLVRITIRDNGVGFDTAAGSTAGRHLGMTIMQVLAEQINGTLKTRSDGGAVVELAFRPGQATT
ncbi:MAG TPA: histidine kinase dimerization/phosphoacceptor domain -containing protein [bacterium]|nr:histidine kinase dimerization/phosphoacceptor domain -containing protein [bacterium]